MSVKRPLRLHCPRCLGQIQLSIYDSVNIARRPELRQAILDDRLQRGTCGACGATLRAPPSLVYLDVPGGLVLLAHPVEDRCDWADVLRDSLSTLAVGFGYGAGRQLLETLTVRVVFGWAALREKLVIQQAQLSDVDIEILKMALVRASDELPFRDDLDLRLVAVDAASLTFAWADVETGDRAEELVVPRSVAMSVKPEGAAWQGLREELSGDAFVDLTRMLVA